MKKSYWIIGVVVVVVAAIALWMLLGRKKAAAVEWRTAKIEKGDIRVTVRASGTLNAVTTVQVGTQVSGIIKKIYVDFNSEVREGQVIALLDTTLLAQTVEDARATLRRNEIQASQSKREWDRTRLLFEQKVVAQADYDLALSTYETAQTNAISAKAALNRALINLKYATIIAPISGVVVSRAVDVGQTVAASFSTPTMFTIANDLTKMQVQANIDEGDIGKIEVGQEVIFTVDAYPEMTFSGTVRQVRLQPVTTQNVVNYTVIIDVPNPDLKLLPGMTANITVLVQEVNDVLKVPATALRFTPSQEYIDAAMKNMPDSARHRFGPGAGEGRGSGSGSRASGSGGGSQMEQHPGGSMNASGQSGMQQGSSGSEMVRRKNFGTIWIKTGDSLKPRRVRTGISDGLNTEIMGRIKEGEEVVVSMTNGQTAQSSTQQQTQNPFVPQPPRGGARGGR
ncbi:MAG: efflux RND transporter periplasmic adaptor subunit [Bacteroidales bacterium]|nr:efflux RND transporter periplasmic adaptor subunit [Bacteroidales bacterium]